MAGNPVVDCSSRGEAIERFLAVIDRHRDRIEATQRKLEKIYRFDTPEKPFFAFQIEKGFEYRLSSWVRNRREHKLDTGMQSIAFQLESLPEADYVPVLATHSGGIDFFPRVFGGDYTVTPEGAFIPKFYLIHDLSEDIDRLPEFGIMQVESVRETLENVEALLEYTRGKVYLGYPYMQGCFNTVYRFMEQESMLVACVFEKEHLKKLMDRICGVQLRIMEAVRRIVGDDRLLRARGPHPPWVRGLVIDDFISVINPADYYDVCCEAWARIHEELGPIYLHTCGPIMACVNLFKKLPGLLSSEFVYAEGQHKTTRQIEELKEKLQGKVVLYSVGMPFGEVVEDMENLTPQWLERMSQDGGFMIDTSGTVEQARKLFQRLEIG